MTALTCAILLLWTASPMDADPMPDVLESFQNVPPSYSQVPFWFWNGPLEPEQFREQLREMADKGVYGAMPHPRFGMDRRQYLGPRYWEAMAATIDEAKKLRMTIWLYDEYNWPSGGAGGHVTDGHPEFYPRGLDYCTLNIQDGPRMVSVDRPRPTESRMERFEKIVRGFIKRADSPMSAYKPWGSISADGVSINGAVPEGKWSVLVFFQCLGQNPSPLDLGSNSMSDFLSEGSVERFVQLTHDQYAKRFGQDFGETIPAIFTDEASTTSPAPFPWTQRFREMFKKRYGYDILDRLPLLLDADSQAGFQTRMAYWQTVTDCFASGFMGHISSWCCEHDIDFTGHVYEEDIACYAHSGQLMTVLGTMNTPGFDALGPRCTPHGAKVAISTAHLKGSKESLCECLGLAGGWNCTLDTLRTGYNVLGGFGVSRFVPHAFFQTVDNPRVECPPSFFYQNPYWKYYRKIADLSSRLSYFNQIGVHVAPCAVYYPVESLWADSVGGKGQSVLPWEHKTVGNKQAERTIKVFNDLVDGLFANRWDLDVVDDHLLASSSVRIENGATKLHVGPESFRVLIVPPVTAIGSETLKAIDRFARQGGTVVWIQRLPRFTWPLKAGQPQEALSRWFGPDQAEVGDTVRVGKGRFALLDGDIQGLCGYLDRELGREVDVSDGLKSLTVTHRKIADMNLYLLFNDSDRFVSGRVDLDGKGSPILVDMDSGKAYAGQANDAGLQIWLRPHQSVCVILSEGKRSLPPWRCDRPQGDRLDISTQWTIQLAGSALDKTWADSIGQTEIKLPVFRMKKRHFSDVGDWTSPEFQDDKWEKIHVLRGQGLFTDNTAILLRAGLPPGARAIRSPLPVTGEYVLSVNGNLIEKNLEVPDTSPGWIDVERLAGEDRNILAMETYSHSEATGLTEPLVVECGPIKLERLQSWTDLGFGYYAGRVLYKKKLRVDESFSRAWLDLGKVEHYVEVFVNGKLVDTILWPPYEIEITKHLVTGDNEITLVVANSIANRFAWDVWGTRGGGRAEPSGLLGPASLWLER